MSRSAKRVRLRLTVTAHAPEPSNGGRTFVCRTRDVSLGGCLLETSEDLEPGTQLELTALDPETGETLSVSGVVAHVAPSPSPGTMAVGVRLEEAGDDWAALVKRAQARTRDTITQPLPRRMRVLVVADDMARRGAMALYVTSGWDVRFATDLLGVEEALRGPKIDAVIAEHQLDSGRWAPVLAAAQRVQPAARRIVRSALNGEQAPPAGGPDDLVHRVVDLQAGLEAVLDALTADWGRVL